MKFPILAVMRTAAPMVLQTGKQWASSEGYAIERTGSLKTESDAPVFVLEDAKGKYRAEMKLINGKFVVQKGSRCRRDWEKKVELEKYSTKRKKLMELGVLVDDGGFLVFQADHEFDFPSEPASIIMTGNVNGQDAWKLSDEPKMSYKKWLREQQGLDT